MNKMTTEKEILDKPCRYYKQYKAIHRPKCKCIPCREKYIDKLNGKAK